MTIKPYKIWMLLKLKLKSGNQKIVRVGYVIYVGYVTHTYIWLARNKEWTRSATNCKLNGSSKETYNSQSSMSSLKQTTKPGSNAKSLRPVGFINKGNTCYANSILQILSVIPTLWNRVPSESNTLSPMLRAISLKMAIKKNSNKPVDPSNFLWVLKRKLSNLIEVPFDFNTRSDRDIASCFR